MLKLLPIGLVVAISMMVVVGSAYADPLPRDSSSQRSPAQTFQKLTGDPSGETDLTLKQYLSSPKFKDDAAKQRAKKWFTKADVNGNGTLSMSEFTTASQKMQTLHPKKKKKAHGKSAKAL